MNKSVAPSGYGIAAAVAVLAFASAATRAQELKTEHNRLSITVSGTESPQPLNRMHSFSLFLKDMNGKAVDGAKILVSGNRRYAPNELPTVPQALAEGRGVYRISGLRFHMAGEWHLVFDVEAGQVRDRASLDVVVK